MKKYFLLFVITFFTLNLYSEVFKMNDGSVIIGDLIEESDNYYIIDKDGETITLKKEKVSEVYENDENSNFKDDKDDENKAEMEYFKDQSEDFILYRKYVRAGIGMVSTGSSLLLLSLPLFSLSHSAYEAHIKYSNLDNDEKYYLMVPYKTRSIILLAVGGGLFSLGAVMDFISIGLFVKARKNYKKYKEKFNQRFSMDIIINDVENPKITGLAAFKF